jgi:hypothetical protein
MKNMLKKLTFILTITLCAQASMHALWGWGNSQSTTDSKSWTTWFLGGAAAIGVASYFGYRYWWEPKKPQQPAGTTTIASVINQRPTSQNENSQEGQNLGTPSLNAAVQAGEIKKTVKSVPQDGIGILLELNRVGAQTSVQHDINKHIRTGNF